MGAARDAEIYTVCCGMNDGRETIPGYTEGHKKQPSLLLQNYRRSNHVRKNHDKNKRDESPCPFAGASLDFII